MDMTAAALLDTDHALFARSVLGRKMKFLEMMDDDFNTAGAIAVLHELAGECNAFIEKNDLERSKNRELAGYVSAGVQTLRNLGIVLGLFRNSTGPCGNRSAGSYSRPDHGIIDSAPQRARASKNFTLADGIRKGLTEIGITLEDRPDGTHWRKD